jgi:hypothetical protein
MENPKFLTVTSTWLDYWYGISFEQCNAECLAKNECTVILWDPDNYDLCVAYGNDFSVISAYGYSADLATLSGIKQCMSECRGRVQNVEIEFVDIFLSGPVTVLCNFTIADTIYTQIPTMGR